MIWDCVQIWEADNQRRAWIDVLETSKQLLAPLWELQSTVPGHLEASTCRLSGSEVLALVKQRNLEVGLFLKVEVYAS